MEKYNKDDPTIQILMKMFNVQQFPAIILRPLKNINEKPLHYYFEGERTIENIKKFLKKYKAY